MANAISAMIIIVRSVIILKLTSVKLATMATLSTPTDNVEMFALIPTVYLVVKTIKRNV